MGDVDLNKATLADVYKLLGNSAYGKTITALKKHLDTLYVDGRAIVNYHNDPYHARTEIITENCYEVNMRKQKITFGLPMVIGLSVYAWAKLRVLQFIYDILIPFIDKSDYMFLESDTDSVYLALYADSLDQLVKPEKQAEWEKIKGDWFVLDPETQKRTPGLLKVEKVGKAFIGLCSKCYIVVADEDDAKAKGIQLKRNKSILTFDNFFKILFELPGAQTEAYNVGIRPLNGDVCTYIQEKYGLTPLYIKRICLPDGSTKPLLL